MRIHVDPDKCTGHSRCSAIAPTLFDTDDYGLSTAVADDVPSEMEAVARRAVLNCPEQAISILDD